MKVHFRPTRMGMTILLLVCLFRAAAALAVPASPLTAVAAAGDALFPFVLPWDGASPGITDLSAWLHPPAGSRGRVTVGEDGHFHAGGERIRFFGVNMSFAGGLPEKDDAPRIAARLAKFGVNVVRFHHMDTSPWPDGLRDREAEGTGELHPEALDRLFWFIAQLKERGIYANINLLVGRPFNRGDGLPAEIEAMDWKDRHVVGFFDEPQQERQRDYARRLLTRRNPHTGLSLAEDPAVAFVEINNENGLVHAWLGNALDTLPPVFQESLRRIWNEWLARRHVSTDALRVAWAVRAEPLGAERLNNTSFAGGTEGWFLEQHQGAEARVEPVREGDVTLARITVTRPGTASWHVQLRQDGFELEAGRPYTLAFRARTDAPAPRPLQVNVAQSRDPWGSLGLSTQVELEREWRPFQFVFNATGKGGPARVVFGNLGGPGSVTELTGVSLRPGGVLGIRDGESVEARSLPLFMRTRFGERTPEAQRDWVLFLSETEERYWQSMVRFLKTELAVNGLVAGTIVGCTTPNLAAAMEWVDTHAYWQHPTFPGRPWDPANWIVENRSMVDVLDNTLPRLARKRILGKPHAVTEYNHAAPNTHGSEAFLLLAAYAGLQDWDAIYAYSYAHSRRQGWDGRRINGFFDIDQHPTKMATLPAAAALFRRGDVHPARRLVAASLPPDQEIDLLRHAGAWSLVDAGTLGVSIESVFTHRVGLVTGGRSVPDAALAPADVGASGRTLRSDTDELTWDLAEEGRGVVTVNTPRSRAVIGHGGGRRFQLGDILIEPGATLQGDWSAITLTAMDDPPHAGAPPSNVRRWLVTATGYADNTGMRWGNAERSTVGRDWGEAPSRVEGITVVLTLPGTARGWALDERGQRREPLPVERRQGQSIVRLGPAFRTLWYEIHIP